MKSPRKNHTGKSPHEKKQYANILKSKEPLNQTYKEVDYSLTNTVLPEDNEDVKEENKNLREYKRKTESNLYTFLKEKWIEIIISIFFIILTIIGFTLNRENGEQNEKIIAINNLIVELNKNFDQDIKDIKDLEISQQKLIDELFEKYNLTDKDLTLINYILKYKKN